MEEISYKKRICNDQGEIDRFLTNKRVGALGMSDKTNMPYTIPVNYVYLNQKIYIHGLSSGKKNKILQENPYVCFAVFEEVGTIFNTVPCKCDTSYFSVIVFGRAALVEDLAEKTEVLKKFLDKFTPDSSDWKKLERLVEHYHSALDNKTVSVYCIHPDKLTAKKNPIKKKNMFADLNKKTS